MGAPPTEDGKAGSEDGRDEEGEEGEEKDEGDDDEGDDDDDDDDDDDKSRKYSPLADDDDDDDDDEMDPSRVGYVYHPGIPPRSKANGNIQYLLVTHDFGHNWTWTPFPTNLQAGGVTVDPTNGASVFAYDSSCLAHSTDTGATWSDCWNKTGLTGSFSRLLVKDASTLFMIRGGAVPLRSTDGGESWTELTSAAPLFKYGAMAHTEHASLCMQRSVRTDGAALCGVLQVRRHPRRLDLMVGQHARALGCRPERHRPRRVRHVRLEVERRRRDLDRRDGRSRHHLARTGRVVRQGLLLCDACVHEARATRMHSRPRDPHRHQSRAPTPAATPPPAAAMLHAHTLVVQRSTKLCQLCVRRLALRRRRGRDRQAQL
jgi:hypothetical protein